MSRAGDARSDPSATDRPAGVPQRAGINITRALIESVPTQPADNATCIDVEGIDSAKVVAECEAANSTLCFGVKYKGQVGCAALPARAALATNVVDRAPRGKS
jgi:hypothetical protein